MSELINVVSIQRTCVNDGDGVRTVIFLHGCRLHCPWCCNPETLSYAPYMLDKDKCDVMKASGSRVCSDCELRSGSRPAYECPVNAATPVCRSHTPEQLYEICAVDKKVYEESGGGITFSGGEPLLQASSLKKLSELLFANNINITLETTLVVDDSQLQIMIPYISHYIIDIKLQPIMYLGNESYLLHIEKMLKMINRAKKTFRIVFIDSMGPVVSRVADNLKRLGVKHIELLACHSLAESKYKKLNMPFYDHKADPHQMKVFANTLERYGISSMCLMI